MRGGLRPDPLKLSKFTIKQKTMKTKAEYNVLSPDGFAIFISLTYPSKKKAFEAFKEWKTRYEKQGFYSSNDGRIDLEDLADYCTLVKFHEPSGMFLPIN